MTAPARMPLIIEPMTMPSSSGAVSGADKGAVRPSKMPRNPPSNRPKSHFFIANSLSGKRVFSFPSPRRELPLSLGENQEENPHDEVSRHEKNGRAMLRRPAAGGVPEAFGIGP